MLQHPCSCITAARAQEKLRAMTSKAAELDRQKAAMQQRWERQVLGCSEALPDSHSG